MHDWGSVSAIDPINPLVYIQASYLALKRALGCKGEGDGFLGYDI
jgi:hypothetical protein